MSDIAIRVAGLGKEYQIGELVQPQSRLGDKLSDLALAPFRRAGKIMRGEGHGASGLNEHFWALKDVSFEIKPGEVTGIIGRNGAGKSTLLKVLSRITEPTTGEAEIHGRIGALLEVGTGFHPELTGRENAFLNGAILGMKRSEIARKFDEIVEFAEIGQFVDTPVKHYSSGMYVRLAFSVAAHLEPEILLIDEVLAVGDTAFQKKCLGKMDDVARQGRTVLFVSHNMGLVQSLCQRGIYLRQGQVSTDGTITEAVNDYLQTLEQAETDDLAERSDRRGRGVARLASVEVYGEEEGMGLKAGGPARFVLQVDKEIPGLGCNIMLFDALGQPVTNFESKVRSPFDSVDPANPVKFVCEVDELFLRPGRYRVDVAVIGDGVLQDFLESATSFDVNEGQIGGRPMMAHKRFRVSMPHRWTLPAE